MVLDGVLVEDRVVRELAAIMDGPLARKLEQALFFSAKGVALTDEEKAAVFAALWIERPGEYDEIRELLLANDRWGQTRAAILSATRTAPKLQPKAAQSAASRRRSPGTVAASRRQADRSDLEPPPARGLIEPYHLVVLLREQRWSDVFETRMRTHEAVIRTLIAGYLGNSPAFDTAVAEFAIRYADQTERDHAALQDAIAAGRVAAQTDL
jgi:hypothetical protein